MILERIEVKGYSDNHCEETDCNEVAEYRLVMGEDCCFDCHGETMLCYKHLKELAGLIKEVP